MKSSQSDERVGVFLDGLNEDGAIGSTSGAQTAKNEGSPSSADECDDECRGVNGWDVWGVIGRIRHGICVINRVIVGNMMTCIVYGVIIHRMTCMIYRVIIHRMI